MTVVILLIPIFLGGALWLGWGRRSTWQETTGWSSLTRAEQARFSAGKKALEDESGAPLVRWHGHSTLLIEWAGVRMVVDPVVRRSLSIIPRLFDGLRLETGLPFDSVLLTHAHMDHFDPASIARLTQSGIILPARTERFLPRSLVGNAPLTVAELRKPIQVGAVEIIPLPAVHGGWRYPWQRGLEALSYLVRVGGRSLYLAGDTAWGGHFEEIGSAYAPDYAVLPIGAYSPAFVLRKRHLNPEQAVAAALALKAKVVIPCHFGTFRLSFEAMAEPLRRFARASALQSAFAVCLPVEETGPVRQS
jgi:L-ascorbate metabolism protein UlaG (beta-lactamase superfamily)